VSNAITLDVSVGSKAAVHFRWHSKNGYSSTPDERLQDANT
jgi:hypothetical protein